MICQNLPYHGPLAPPVPTPLDFTRICVTLFQSRHIFEMHCFEYIDFSPGLCTIFHNKKLLNSLGLIQSRIQSLSVSFSDKFFLAKSKSNENLLSFLIHVMGEL